MTKRELATILLLAALLVACSENRNVGRAPDPEPPVTRVPNPGGHFLGVLSQHSAGPFRLVPDTRNCDDFIIVNNDTTPSAPHVDRCLGAITQDDGLGPDSYDLDADGQIIELFASPESERDNWIDIRHAAIGRVDAVDLQHAQMTMLGQRILVTDQTYFAGFKDNGQPLEFSNVSAGDRVAVSGHVSGQGWVAATRIEVAADPDLVLLRGILSASAAQPFTIGDLEVDFSGASIEAFPGGAPLPGDSVLLAGNQEPQAGVLAVQTARYDGGNWDSSIWASGQPISFLYSGAITRFSDPYDFEVAGHDFNYSTWDCTDCVELQAQQKEVRPGRLVIYRCCDVSGNSNLWLLWPASTTTLVGPVDSIDAATGTLRVLGYTVQTSPATHVSEYQYPGVGTETLDLGELATGDTVTVGGGALGDLMVAGWISRIGEGRYIRSSQYDLADPDILIMNQEIQTDASTTVEECDLDDICVIHGADWLFSSEYDPSWTLSIGVDGQAPALHATYVLVETNFWTP